MKQQILLVAVGVVGGFLHTFAAPQYESGLQLTITFIVWALFSQLNMVAIKCQKTVKISKSFEKLTP